MHEVIQLVDLLKAQTFLTIATSYQGQGTTDKRDHYRWSVTVSLKGESLTTDFRCGMAHVTKPPKWDSRAVPRPTPPSLADVVYSLASDAYALDESFEDWCSSFGYDPDSRKALDIYLACQKSGRDLQRVLGHELFEAVRGAEH